MSQILLVHPVYSGTKKRSKHRSLPAPSLGVNHLATRLCSDGLKTYVIDDFFIMYRGGDPTFFDSWLSECVRVIKLYRISIIGVSILTHFRALAYDICQTIKKLYPHIKIILGGPHISTLGSYVLSHVQPFADAIFVGEADNVITDVVKTVLSDDEECTIPGLVFTNRPPRKWPVYQQVEVQHHVVMPTYRNYPDSISQFSRINIMTSRGCPTPFCTFCAIKNGGEKFRTRSFEQSRGEILQAVENGAKIIEIHDSIFLLSTKRIRSIFTGLNLGNISEFHCHTRPRDIRPEMLKIIAETGRKWKIVVGVESISQQLRKSICKSDTIDKDTIELSNNIKLARELGIQIGVFLIFGLPGETVSDFRKTYNFIANTEIDDIFCTILKYLPGSQLFFDASVRGVISPNDFARPDGPITYYVPTGDNLLRALAAISIFSEDFPQVGEHNRLEFTHMEKIRKENRYWEIYKIVSEGLRGVSSSITVP
jgi:radical SAM superfamily enzyme YgiQ (UPF0313 family)